MSEKPLTAAEMRFALAFAVGCGFVIGWMCCLVLLGWQGVIG